MTLPTVIEQKGIRVLTSKQIAEKYETSTDIIKKNFSNNRKRYVEGKHYILLTGDELKAFKNQVNNVHLVDGRTSHLYLWTEKGALFHAKSLNTDKAWEVYDYLVDFYFRVKEEVKPEEIKRRAGEEVVDIPESVQIQKAIKEAEHYIIALQVSLKEYNKYRSQEDYERYYAILNNLLRDMTGKVRGLLEIRPNVVTKEGVVC